jgi:hypothetical protein
VDLGRAPTHAKLQRLVEREITRFRLIYTDDDDVGFVARHGGILAFA